MSKSIRTTVNFLDVGGRDEMVAKVVGISLCMWLYHSMFFGPLISMIWFRPSTKTPKDTRAPSMRKLEWCYLIGKEQKSKELYHGLQMSGLIVRYLLYLITRQMLKTTFDKCSWSFG